MTESKANGTTSELELLRSQDFPYAFLFFSSIILAVFLAAAIPRRAVTMFVRSQASRIDRLTPLYTPLGVIRRMVGNCMLQIMVKGTREFLMEASGRLLRNDLFIETITTLDDEYRIWLNRHALTRSRLGTIENDTFSFRRLPEISIIMPVYKTKIPILRRAINSVLSQIYPGWQLCIVDDGSHSPVLRELLSAYASEDQRIILSELEENNGIAAASNQALRMATGEFVGFLDHDDELTPDACLEVVKALNNDPSIDLLYSDEDKLDESGKRVEVFFKPDWSPDLILSENYVSHFSVFRKALLESIGCFRNGFEGSQDYDLILRVAETTDKIHHVPKPLYSWRKFPGSAAHSPDSKPYAYKSAKRALRSSLAARGIAAKVSDGRFLGQYRVAYQIHGNPTVSVIVLESDGGLLERCIRSIRSKSTYPHLDLLVLLNPQVEGNQQETLRKLGCRVVESDSTISYSSINEVVMTHALGDHLVFLSGRVEIVSRDWVENMLQHSQREEVGAVGGRLVLPGGNILLGFSSSGDRAFRIHAANWPGYFGLQDVVHNCSAVTLRCMMTKKSVFENLQGFDAGFKRELADVDFCFRARRNGLNIVYEPNSEVNYRAPSSSSTSSYCSSDHKRFRRRWNDLLQHPDPYYNPNLDPNRLYHIAC